MKSEKPKFELAIDTRLLYQRLVQVQEGETVSYEQLGESVSRKLSGADYHLQSAIRRARRDDDMIFDNIMGVGYRRMTPSEIVASSDNDVSRLRRHAKRSTEKLFKVKDFSRLTNEEKLKHATSASVFGAIAASLTKKGITAVEGAVKMAGHEIPVAETLKLFAR
jgi:hypothetical protein